jgi:hypothetical protein
MLVAHRGEAFAAAADERCNRQRQITGNNAGNSSRGAIL